MVTRHGDFIPTIGETAKMAALFLQRGLQKYILYGLHVVDNLI